MVLMTWHLEAMHLSLCCLLGSQPEPRNVFAKSWHHLDQTNKATVRIIIIKVTRWIREYMKDDKNSSKILTHYLTLILSILS